MGYLFDNHDMFLVFVKSEMGSYGDQDRVDDLVGDIDEREICGWSEKELIEDISEDIAEKVLEWLKPSK